MKKIPKKGIHKTLTQSVIIGIVVTLITGILMNLNIVGELPNIMVSSEPILGVSYWGYPLAWISQVVYPGAVKQVIWINLIVDIVIWSFFVLVVLKIKKK